MEKVKLDTIKQVLKEHGRRWPSSATKAAQQYHRAYMHRFWDDERPGVQDAVETSAAYRHVEGTVNSLYGRNPAVSVRYGIHGLGDPTKARGIANTWLATHARWTQEMATRIALIWDFCLFKLTPNDTSDVWHKVTLSYVLPWDVVIDPMAPSWDDVQYVGDRHYVRVERALKRFPKTRRADWTATHVEQHLDVDVVDNPDDSGAAVGSREQNAPRQLGKDSCLLADGVVTLYEIYFPDTETWVVWSPHYGPKDGFVYQGSMPVKDYAGNVQLPYVPLYYSTDPARPMTGYSSVRRVYDQIAEENLLRSYAASGVRRGARTWLAPKGLLNAETKAALASGKDGVIVEVDVPAKQIKDVVSPMQMPPISGDVWTYQAVVSADLQSATNTAPFTRGDATGVSATEIMQLSQYTDSELGKQARTRDEAFVRLAALYLNYLYLHLAKAQVVVINNEAVVVRPQDVLGDFIIYPTEAESTPQARAKAQQEFLNVAPLLQGLGVSPDSLLQKFQTLFDGYEGLDIMEVPTDGQRSMAAENAANAPGGMTAGLLQ